MVQLTIDFLLSSSPNIKNNHLFLQWNQRNNPEQLPIFSQSSKHNFSHGFLNKLIHMPTIICGNISKRKDKILQNISFDEEIPEYTNIHFLKSHLQKSIRQKQTELAIQTAKHLLEIDPIQFLRRLSIIFIEDVMITKHYSTIIWLMIACSSKKFQLQLHHKEWLLGLIYIACQCPYKDTYNAPHTQKIPQLILQEASKIGNAEYYATIISILIRCSYGGMHGDTKMLINAAYTWTQRFQNPDKWEKYYSQDNRTISYSVLPLQKNDWLTSAIDFHCFPKMLEWIKEQENIPEDYAKHLIWHFSSKINTRKNYNNSKKNTILPPEDEENWNKIKNKINNIARYAIKNYS